jgi:DNA-binding transcriptional regulator LsrR (DeoR family)
MEDVPLNSLVLYLKTYQSAGIVWNRTVGKLAKEFGTGRKEMSCRVVVSGMGNVEPEETTSFTSTITRLSVLSVTEPLLSNGLK